MRFRRCLTQVRANKCALSGVQIRRHRHRAPFVGGIYYPIERLGGVLAGRQHADVIEQGVSQPGLPVDSEICCPPVRRTRVHQPGANCPPTRSLTCPPVVGSLPRRICRSLEPSSFDPLTVRCGPMRIVRRTFGGHSSGSGQWRGQYIARVRITNAIAWWKTLRVADRLCQILYSGYRSV
jgi:hypothetical protein